MTSVASSVPRRRRWYQLELQLCYARQIAIQKEADAVKIRKKAQLARRKSIALIRAEETAREESKFTMDMQSLRMQFWTEAFMQLLDDNEELPEEQQE